MEVAVASEHIVKADDALDALKDTVYGSVSKPCLLDVYEQGDEFSLTSDR